VCVQVPTVSEWGTETKTPRAKVPCVRYKKGEAGKPVGRISEEYA
jgi:hypothetical protein